MPRRPPKWKRQLAKIWSQVFRLPEVGIHDNFFELGGDSIISIQIVTKANRPACTSRPATFSSSKPSPAGSRGRSWSGSIGRTRAGDRDVPLTPVQLWFFEQGFTQPQHWNQSLWLDVPANVDRKALQLAFNHMPKQHDMLRARYRRSADGAWQQSIRGEVIFRFHWNTMTCLRCLPANRMRPCKSKLGCWNLHPQSGDWPDAEGSAVFTWPGPPLRLLVTCHHLVVDGVSWQPLLADWETAYHQIQLGQPVQLPSKTTSFKEWAERLVKYAQSPALTKNLSYWQSSILANSQLQELDQRQKHGAGYKPSPAC
jgi:hypothetical protein